MNVTVSPNIAHVPSSKDLSVELPPPCVIRNSPTTEHVRSSRRSAYPLITSCRKPVAGFSDTTAGRPLPFAETKLYRPTAEEPVGLGIVVLPAQAVSHSPRKTSPALVCRVFLRLFILDLTRRRPTEFPMATHVLPLCCAAGEKRGQPVGLSSAARSRRPAQYSGEHSDEAEKLWTASLSESKTSNTASSWLTTSKRRTR